jgi:pentatricopeptide repeat protein
MSSLIVTKSAGIKNRLIQGFSCLKHLKHIHAALLRLGLDEDTYLLNKVLRFSFNFGNTNYSFRILDQTKEPNIFLFNTMIRGLVLNDCFQESIEIYHSMRKEGLSPDSFTFPFVLKACARVLDSELGVKMHSLVVKAGCEADAFVKISLINLYAKCGFIDNAFKVFDDIPDKNFASWTATISGYVGVGKCREAIDMFRRLLEMGLRPDSFSLVEVLSACKRTGDLRSGEWIDEYITENGMVRNVFVATALVDFYGKCGNMERARSVFDGMLEKNIVSWSSMIQGYASNGLPKEALDLFFKMLNEGLKPDCYAMVGVLCSCARLGALELGDWASNLINGNEFLDNSVLGTALIDM